MTTTDYVLSISVPYNELLHGTYKLTNFNSNYEHECLKYGYLCMYSIPLNEFYDNNNLKEWYKFIYTYSSAFIRDNILQENIVGVNHSITINYLKKAYGLEIIKKNKIKIVDPTISDDDCYITTSIIKTHYIRLIQRKWKRLYKQMIKNRGNLNNLRHREIYGTWPTNCKQIL